MNLVLFAAIATIFAIFAIFCGIKLFDLGSTLSDPIRRYGGFLAVIFAFVAIFNFLIVDALELKDGGFIALVIVSTIAALCLVSALIDSARLRLTKGRTTSLKKQLALGSFDVLGGLATGVAIGCSFALTSGAGILSLCALILFMISRKVAIIYLYQNAHYSRRANAVTLVISLCVIPIVAPLVCAFLQANTSAVAFALSLAAGYFGYLSLAQLLEIVKKYQKR